MIPWNFEWVWDIGHYIFFGLFYAAVGVIFLGLMVAAFMTVKHLNAPAHEGHGPGEEGAEAAEDAPEAEAKPA